MPRTFSGRLFLGTMLPLLLVALGVGSALLELVPERILLPALAREMVDQGILIARLGTMLPEIWTDPGTAQAFLEALAIQQPTQVLLLDPEGQLLAVSPPGGFAPGDFAAGPLFERARGGALAWQATLRGADSDIAIDVLIPVTNEQGGRPGYVRLLRRLPDVAAGLRTARRLILGIIGTGLALSGLAALLLAQSLSRPLQQTAQAMAAAPLGGPAQTLPEVGPQEVRLLIRTFNRLQTRRAQLEEARRLMLRGIVHEFGRLIGAAQAALHALQSGAAEDPALRRELLHGMSQTMVHLTRLLEDLAQAAPQGGPLPLKRQRLEPAAWLRERALAWAAAARMRGLLWQEEIPPDLPCLDGDPERLAQALDNLVDNALKFTPPGGCVTLRAGVRDREVWFQVQDTGPGIPPEERPRLFEPFYRGSQEGRPGLGLGLFLARMIAEAHGGRIEVESEPGKGSTFTFVVPAAPEGREPAC